MADAGVLRWALETRHDVVFVRTIVRFEIKWAKVGVEVIARHTHKHTDRQRRPTIWAEACAQWVCENKMKCETVIISICSLNFIWTFFARIARALLAYGHSHFKHIFHLHTYLCVFGIFLFYSSAHFTFVAWKHISTLPPQPHAHDAQRSGERKKTLILISIVFYIV